MGSLREYKRLNTRQASAVKVGGFRPTGDPFATHFGLRPLAAAGEAWPVSNGKPLLFLCQFNLTTAPFLPGILKDMALLTFFAEIDALQLGQENGANWVLRGYTSLEGLALLDPPASTPALKRRFECSWELVEDHPHYDDHELVVPKGFDNSDVELENAARTRSAATPRRSRRRRGGATRNTRRSPHSACRSTAKRSWGSRLGTPARFTSRGERRRAAGISGFWTGSAFRGMGLLRSLAGTARRLCRRTGGLRFQRDSRLAQLHLPSALAFHRVRLSTQPR